MLNIHFFPSLLDPFPALYFKVSRKVRQRKRVKPYSAVSIAAAKTGSNHNGQVKASSTLLPTKTDERYNQTIVII
jgi:hypothetical protein